MLKNLVIQVLLYAITPRTAEILASMLVELLEELADQTQTNIDDALVDLLSRFLVKAAETDPNISGHANRLRD